MELVVIVVTLGFFATIAAVVALGLGYTKEAREAIKVLGKLAGKK